VKNTAATFIGLGAVLGYAASASNWNPFERAVAAPTIPSIETASATTPVCCAETNLRANLLAQVTAHNSKVSANMAQAGKKPNIVMILADDGNVVAGKSSITQTTGPLGNPGEDVDVEPLGAVRVEEPGVRRHPRPGPDAGLMISSTTPGPQNSQWWCECLTNSLLSGTLPLETRNCGGGRFSPDWNESISGLVNYLTTAVDA
jgi:hypothetical protein